MVSYCVLSGRYLDGGDDVTNFKWQTRTTNCVKGYTVESVRPGSFRLSPFARLGWVRLRYVRANRPRFMLRSATVVGGSNPDMG